MTLWRLAPDDAAGEAVETEAASLEDVVLGYLAAGRGTGLQLN